MNNDEKKLIELYEFECISKWMEMADSHKIKGFDVMQSTALKAEMKMVADFLLDCTVYTCLKFDTKMKYTVQTLTKLITIAVFC